MAKCRILYYINDSIRSPKEKRQVQLYDDFICKWVKTVFPWDKTDTSPINVEPYSIIREVHFVSFLDMHSKQQMSKEYRKYSLNYDKTILVFFSIYDINPNIKKSLRYINNLMNIGYEIYLFNISFSIPTKRYFNEYCFYCGGDWGIPKRERSTKRLPRLMELAAMLRCQSDPVTYKTITEYTEIPKSTLISYMNRNGIKYESRTGRNYLTEEEKDRIRTVVKFGTVIK